MTANCSVIISLNCDELYAPKCNAKGKFKKNMENKRKLAVKN